MQDNMFKTVGRNTSYKWICGGSRYWSYDSQTLATLQCSRKLKAAPEWLSQLSNQLLISALIVVISGIQPRIWL